MASSPPDRSQEVTPEQRDHMRDSFQSFIHNTSLAMLVVAPVLIALPPRKLDMYTFLLGTSFVLSANQVTRERTGSGILSKFNGFGDKVTVGSSLPPRAQEIQAQMRARKEQQRLLEEPVQAREGGRKSSSLLEEKAKEIWMGGEKEGWKEKRLKEEQEKIDQGEGYGSMIMDQIWEVWNWGEKKGEELKKKDEAVIKDLQRAREFPKIGKD